MKAEGAREDRPALVERHGMIDATLHSPTQGRDIAGAVPFEEFLWERPPYPSEQKRCNWKAGCNDR